jgi:ATP-dependent helicase/nuclease subunit A
MNIIPKPEGVFWSDDQWKAITLAGEDMLVAAAAGSGKTAVLVERIIRKLCDTESPIDVDRLLVATFTKAAAAEMRHRIGEALETALERNPNHSHLKRQLAMLGSASITTLHSFCMEVIQRHYTLIPLDPGFRIAAESETSLLRQEVLEELFEQKYSNETGQTPFLSLVDWYGGEKGDDAVFWLVLRLYDFSRSHPWPEVWLQQATDMFVHADEQNLQHNVWIKSIMQDVLLTLEGALGRLEQGKAIAMVPGGPAPYIETLEADSVMVQTLMEGVRHQAWASWHELFQTVSFGKLKPCKKDQTDPMMQERVKALRDEVKKSLSALQTQLFGRTTAEFIAELHHSAPLMQELATLVSQFAEAYRIAKVSRGWLDFSDLEHYALQILRHQDATPTELLPSDAALEYQQQYEEILLDEYQDTNTVQEEIVRLISRTSPGNRFMVGDVKQSIYRFRLADPGLFLDKYRRYQYGDSMEGGYRIDLARNFRSRSQVIDTVNLIFRQIMDEMVGEINYDERAELIYGEGYTTTEEDNSETSIYTPEWLLIDRSEESLELDSAVEEHREAYEEQLTDEVDKAELDAVVLESRVISARIHGLMGATGESAFQVYDKGLKENRPVRYSDIVILLRSTASWAKVMMEELSLQGIPVVGELNQGYFDAIEVETMLSFLQIIDNPLQDIPLAAVLRSPVYGLTEDELAQIALYRPKERGSSFYQGLEHIWTIDELAGATDKNETTEYIEMTVNAAEKLSSLLLRKLETFKHHLESWRSFAREGQLSMLIWKIYSDTGYLNWVGGLPAGAQRQANLQALHDRARQYEQSTMSSGLFPFLRYITRLRENGGDLGAAVTSSDQSNAVRIMTIHKSKGLEFPVVFIAGLAKQFNRQDLNGSFLVHKELGFGPKYVDEALRVSYPMLPNLAIRRRAELELLAEEMRVLYVALTRPREKLIMVSAVKDLLKSIEAWGSAIHVQGQKLPDHLLARAKCYLDWIGPALIRHPSALPLREAADLMEPSTQVFEGMKEWNIVISVAASQYLAMPAAATLEQMDMGSDLLNTDLQLSSTIDQHVYDEIHTKLAWKYPYQIATRIPAQTSVTEMKAKMALQNDPNLSIFERKQIRDEQARWSGQAPEVEKEVVYQLHLQRPRFMEQMKLSPTERGTAYHMLMQHVPFDVEPSVGIIQETIAKLILNNILTAPQGEVIDPQRIVDFLLSPVGGLLRQAQWVRREVPFSFGLAVQDTHADLLTDLLADRNEEGFQRRDLPFTAQSEELADEVVLLQGVIDCLFCVDDKLYLLDYKSDKVNPHLGGIEALAAYYQFQLELYQKAIQEMTGQVVHEKWLYFFDQGEAIKI